MVNFEKFKNKHINILEKFTKKNFASFNQNFLEVYMNSKNIDKYILKKNFYFVKYDEKYIGYIWIEKISLNEYRILDMYILLDYIKFFKINELSKLNKKVLIYEGIEDYENISLLKNNSFYKMKSVNLLRKVLHITNITTVEDISFKKFKINEDEELRAYLQNNIFYSVDRIPINKLDIKFEQSTINYINDFSIFEYIGNIPIGYAQIIKRNNKYILVNFGVLKEFRGKGFGKILLNYMCKLAKKNNINNLYIYVDSKNYVALKLYQTFGFEFFGNIGTWLKD
ncbi:MAG: GNAT family N-acetyltransferase [Clostridium sp.]|uniref:GNAT family N-acetyltransferase n=1 Tax=Clostridium sp. TaxID=1506 RepID=UPI003EE7251B